MGVKEDYEDLSGEYDAEVMRAYLNGGYVPSPGMALGLIAEVEWRENELAANEKLIADQRRQISQYVAIIGVLADAQSEMSTAWVEGVEIINERMRHAVQTLREKLEPRNG